MHKLLLAILTAALVIAWAGLVVLAYRIHPALAAVTLFFGWLDFGARHSWLRNLDDPRS